MQPSHTITDPCAHLSGALSDHARGLRCSIGRTAPHDCRACSAYRPETHDAGRARWELWHRVLRYHRSPASRPLGKLADQPRQPLRERPEQKEAVSKEQ